MEQTCNSRAKEVLDKYKIKVVSDLSLTWNKRDSDDWVTQYVFIDDEEVYQHYYPSSISSSEADNFDEFGIRALSSCVRVTEKENYKDQVQKFKKAISELMSLKSAHKFTHGAEKKELRAECEDLCVFGSSQRGPHAGERVNIPLLEDNVKKIQQVLEELKELEKQSQSEADQAGPVMNKS